MMNKLNNSYYPFDKIIIAYCKVMIILILIFGRPLVNYVDELFTYSIAAAIAILLPLTLNESQGRLSAFFRLMYSVILFGIFYRTTGGTMFLVSDHFFDNQVVAFETSLYTMEPTLYIDYFLLSPMLNEIFSFCYFCYYLMIPAFLIALFVKKDYGVLKRYLTAASLTYAVSFLIFSLYPVESPRWHFEGQYLNNIDGYLFRHLVELVIGKGGLHGGGMPSTHVAIAVVIMMFCFRHYRNWGWVLLPINIGLAIGTVWGRFHYAADVYAGIIFGLAAYYLVEKKYEYWTNPVSKALTEKELKTNLVS